MSVGWVACDPWQNRPGSQVWGENRMNTRRNPSVPYCPGGQRDKGCVLGSICNTTEKGCQVCQCESLEE